MNVILAVTLLLCFVGSSFGNDDGRPCGPYDSRCTCANFIMDCKAREMEDFPVSVPYGVKTLYLNSNHIRKISQIKENSALQTLVLSDNEIEQLTYDAFDNLDNLKILQLSNNKISYLWDDVFEWNPQRLQVLYLDNNKLEFIQHFLFYDLEDLTDLYLQNNDITFVHPHAFLQLKKLRNLRLDGNKLHTFNPKWIDRLQDNAFIMLRFDGNPWSCDCAMNPAQKWFSTGESTWFLHVTEKHPITCVSPRALENRNLKNLTLKEVNLTCDIPRITAISKSMTISRGRDVLLKCIYDHNRLPVPTVSWTAPNNDIFRLDTAGNFDGITVHQNGDLLIQNLSAIDDGSYTCNVSNVVGYATARTKITVKRLQHQEPGEETMYRAAVEAPDESIINAFTTQCPDQCQCISMNIDCSSDGTTAIKDIPNDIPTDAITLTLASNNLTKLTANDFLNFRDLEELRLDDNKIKTIESRTFYHLQQLTTLTLSGNELDVIEPKTFLYLQRLSVLVLDRNKLTKLTAGMFKGLLRLQWLYVRQNLITTISNDAFAPLYNIKFIHLNSNYIRVLYPPMVKTLLNMPNPQIKKIFVDDNNIQCDCNMEDMRLYIRNENWQYHHNDNIFGDGIVCSNPPKWAGVILTYIDDFLRCNGSENKLLTPLPDYKRIGDHATNNSTTSTDDPYHSDYRNSNESLVDVQTTSRSKSTDSALDNASADKYHTTVGSTKRPIIHSSLHIKSTGNSTFFDSKRTPADDPVPLEQSSHCVAIVICLVVIIVVILIIFLSTRYARNKRKNVLISTSTVSMKCGTEKNFML